MKQNPGSVRQSLTTRLAQHMAVASGVLLVAGLATTGCLDRELRPLVPCVSQGFVQSVAQNAVDKVDLLFMVDNSGSMGEEQASLGAELPRLVSVLASGDRTGDGPSADDFQAVKNLHVGVVTSDMGVASFNVPTCTTRPQFGDDGLLRTQGATAIGGCMAVYPKFLEYQPGISTQTPTEFGFDFKCVATTGNGGCGFEQQLESPLKAVTPAGSALTFYGGTHGHGDVVTENGGFLRTDSVLAIVVVSDEEDCSIATGFEGIFDQSATSAYVGNLNLRCYHYPETQWPIERYLNGFKALRPGHEDLVVFGAIAGVPVDLIPVVVPPSTVAPPPDYTAILADPRMTATVDAAGTGLEPSCNVPGRGIAFAPRRMVQLAQAFGDNGVIQSICQESFSGALNAIIAKIADALGNVCLPRKLNPDAEGLVGCDVVEVIPSPTGPRHFDGQPTSCADLGTGVNPDAKRTDPNGDIVCGVIQRATTGGVAPTTGEGWYYDDFSADTHTSCGLTGQRIAFTPGAIPPNGVTVNLECLQRIQGTGTGTGMAIEVGSFCDTAADICPSAAGMTLLCEPKSRTCQVSCAATNDCPSSLVCSFCGNGNCDLGEDHPSCASDCIDGQIGSGTTPGYCVNPICVD